MQNYENLSRNKKWTWVPTAQKSPFMMRVDESKTSKGSREAGISGLQVEEELINVFE